MEKTAIKAWIIFRFYKKYPTLSSYIHPEMFLGHAFALLLVFFLLHFFFLFLFITPHLRRLFFFY